MDCVFTNKIGSECVKLYLKVKNDELKNYLDQFTDWEFTNTLDI